MQLSDAEVAVTAVEARAAVVRARFGTPLDRFEKAPMDFATDADIDAEQAILDVLRAARPADAYQGEELGPSGNGSSDRTWLIDPLCGTVNFAAQTPLVAVNVALRDGDRTQVAACADPVAGEVFWSGGEYAHGRRGGSDWPLSPSSGTRLVEVNLDPPHPNHDRFQAVRMLAGLYPPPPQGHTSDGCRVSRGSMLAREAGFQAWPEPRLWPGEGSWS